MFLHSGGGTTNPSDPAGYYLLFAAALAIEGVNSLPSRHLQVHNNWTSPAVGCVFFKHRSDLFLQGRGHVHFPFLHCSNGAFRPERVALLPTLPGELCRSRNLKLRPQFLPGLYKKCAVVTGLQQVLRLSSVWGRKPPTSSAEKERTVKQHRPTSALYGDVTKAIGGLLCLLCRLVGPCCEDLSPVWRLAVSQSPEAPQ